MKTAEEARIALSKAVQQLLKIGYEAKTKMDRAALLRAEYYMDAIEIINQECELPELSEEFNETKLALARINI